MLQWSECALYGKVKKWRKTEEGGPAWLSTFGITKTTPEEELFTGLNSVALFYLSSTPLTSFTTPPTEPSVISYINDTKCWKYTIDTYYYWV